MILLSEIVIAAVVLLHFVISIFLLSGERVYSGSFKSRNSYSSKEGKLLQL